MGPKNKLGQKIDQFKKKNGILGKKQAEAELKKKKQFFWAKIGEKFDDKVQKLPNFKGKKGLFRTKNKLGLSLGTKKKDFVGQKFGKNFENKVQKLTNFTQ